MVEDTPAFDKVGKSHVDMDTLEEDVGSMAHVGMLLVDVRSHKVDEGREVAEVVAEAGVSVY